jgi:hypothetical protein
MTVHQALVNDTSKHRPAPLRHGVDIRASRRMASQLRLFIKGDPEPDEACWSAMGDDLWQGDKLADDLVAWMHEAGMGRAWGLFERALQAPASLDASVVPAPLRNYLAAAQATPDWVDAAQLKLGAQVMQATGMQCLWVLRDAGLMAGYQASAINQPLIQTGALTKGAQRRLAETTSWWMACTEDDGMAVGAPGFAMTLRVRVIHALVRHQLLRGGQWDENQLGLPINQLDLQATYMSFSVVQLLGLKLTGVWLTTRESEAVMHLWRYIGWLMGVDERLLCDNEQAGRVALYRNVLSQAPAAESTAMLGRALMDEPLHRPYHNLAWLRGRVNKARHLSLLSWFVGWAGMRRLGVPVALPWYPLLMLAPLALHSTLMHMIPGAWWARRGRAAQHRHHKLLLGGKLAKHLIGDASHHDALAR